MKTFWLNFRWYFIATHKEQNKFNWSKILHQQKVLITKTSLNNKYLRHQYTLLSSQMRQTIVSLSYLFWYLKFQTTSDTYSWGESYGAAFYFLAEYLLVLSQHRFLLLINKQKTICTQLFKKIKPLYTICKVNKTRPQNFKHWLF